MKICFMGSMEFAVPILVALNEKYGVDLVVTQPDKPFGRKQIMQGTPVKNKALELGIELFQPQSIKKDNSKITDREFDLIIVAAYGQIIPENILYHAKYQAINVHASLLPKYRGGSPMHQAIIDGEVETGVTIMYMEKSLDSGFILSQAKCEITENDNVKTLENKLSVLGKDLLIKTLDKLLSGDIKPKPQDEKLVTYAYNYKKHDLKIDFNKTSKQLYNQVRGMYPWPIAEMEVKGHKIKVYETAYEKANITNNPGEIVLIDKKGVYIQTGLGLLILKTIQLEGKKVLDINSFMNGVGKTLFNVGQILKTSL